jgi:hypothetical protein
MRVYGLECIIREDAPLARQTSLGKVVFELY